MMKLQVIKRAVLTLAAVAGIALAVQAQEYPVNNQYYFNYYLINLQWQERRSVTTSC